MEAILLSLILLWATLQIIGSMLDLWNLTWKEKGLLGLTGVGLSFITASLYIDSSFRGGALALTVIIITTALTILDALHSREKSQ